MTTRTITPTDIADAVREALGSRADSNGAYSLWPDHAATLTVERAQKWAERLIDEHRDSDPFSSSHDAICERVGTVVLRLITGLDERELL